MGFSAECIRYDICLPMVIPGGSVCNLDIPMPEDGTDVNTGDETGIYAAKVMVWVVT